MRDGTSTLARAVAERLRSDETARGVGVKEVSDEMGVPDSSREDRRRGSAKEGRCGSLVVGEVGP